jgi:hypothetical protein
MRGNTQEKTAVLKMKLKNIAAQIHFQNQPVPGRQD